jgi:hypothetical protein
MSWLLSEPGKLLLPAYMPQDLHAQMHVGPLQLMFRLRAPSTMPSVLSSSSSSMIQQLPDSAAGAPLFRAPAAAAAAASEDEEDEEEASWAGDAGPVWFRPAAETPSAAEAEYAFSALLVLVELFSLNIKSGPGAWDAFAPLVDFGLRAEGSITRVRQHAGRMLAAFLTDLMPAVAAAARAAAGSSSGRPAAAAAAMEEDGGTVRQLSGLVTNMIMFSELKALRQGLKSALCCKQHGFERRPDEGNCWTHVLVLCCVIS